MINTENKKCLQFNDASFDIFLYYTRSFEKRIWLVQKEWIWLMSPVEEKLTVSIRLFFLLFRVYVVCVVLYMLTLFNSFSTAMDGIILCNFCQLTVNTHIVLLFIWGLGMCLNNKRSNWHGFFHSSKHVLQGQVWLFFRFWFRRRTGHTGWVRETWSVSTTWWPEEQQMTTSGKSIN
jgi:hypothetical protein